MIDWDKALESVNADRKLLVEVVQILANELPDLHNELRSATSSKDADAIRSAAHKFKGSVRFLGPSTVYDIVESVELLEPMDFARADECVTRLNDETDCLSKTLSAFIANSDG